MLGKAYGIGVGPGDPKLLTVKALEILAQLKIVFYPSFGKNSIALDIARSHINPDAKLIEMNIPLFPYKAKVAAYQNFANQIKEYLDNQVDVGVLCEGDPLFFGSFITIRDLLKKNYQVNVVSGISSIMSAFVHVDDFMGQGDDIISIITAGTDERLIKDKISTSNTTIVIKVAKHLKKIKTIAANLGLLETAMYISKIDQAQQYSGRQDMISDDVIEYFSIIIIKNPMLSS